MFEKLHRFMDRSLYHVEAWIHTRQLRLLLQGVPALLIGAGLILIVTHQHFGAGEARLERYRVAFRIALDEQESAKTAILARKLVQLAPQDLDARFALAWLADQRGDTAQARKLMRQLAPEDTIGYARAHFWLANSMLQEQSRFTAEQTASVVHHLNGAIDSGAHRQVAHILLATVHAGAKNFEQAAVHLDAVVVQRPDLRLQLAKVYAALGKTAQSRAELQQAREYFAQQVKAEPANQRMRVLWAQAVGQDGDYSQAESILLKGLEHADSPELHSALAQLYVAMFDQHKTPEFPESAASETEPIEEAPPLSQRLQLLQKALQHSANDAQTLIRLAALARQSEIDSDAARALLQERLTQGEIPESVHLILGTSAAAAFQWDEARVHLELAYQLNPESPVLLNNLAWVLASSTGPGDQSRASTTSTQETRLQRALQLVDRGLEMAPDHPELHATRGRVLMKLQRWPEAATDLKLALAQIPDRAEWHQAIAEVYQNLGQDELATEHARRGGTTKDTEGTKN